MTTCSRCLIPKPDACFALHGRWGAATSPLCTQCRATGDLAMKTAPRTPVAPLTPSPSYEALVAIARRERDAYLDRGARSFPRPYTFARGELVRNTCGINAALRGQTP